MNIILQYYEDMVDFADKLISKGPHKLFCGYDAVHSIVAAKLQPESKEKFKKLIWFQIRIGCINSCSVGSLKTLSTEDKHCTKCKTKKWINEFPLLTENRRGRKFSYYSSHCKKCLEEYKKIYNKTPKAKARIYAYIYGRNKIHASALTDYYIRSVLKNAARAKGIQLKTEDISAEDIEQKRQIILANRAKRQNKANQDE